jgi:hypothetical protein
MVEIYTQVTYQVTPDRLRDHFMALVDTSITTTEAQLGAYVAAYVRRHVEAARRAIQGYSQRCVCVWGGGGCGCVWRGGGGFGCVSRGGGGVCVSIRQLGRAIQDCSQEVNQYYSQVPAPAS